MMAGTEPSGPFWTSADSYNRFMGRYSTLLAPVFLDAAGVQPSHDVIDVGCGTGALTSALVDRVTDGTVRATDPTPAFVEHCASRFPDLDVRPGRAEEVPFDDRSCDRVLSQLVLHFVAEPDAAATEMRRVLRPGGRAAACVWDFEQGMEMLRAFWDAALEIDSSAPDEARVLRFGGPGEIASLFDRAGFVEITETTLTVSSSYADFDELWSTFLLGIGPAGAYCTSLAPDAQDELRRGLERRLGSPPGAFSLAGTARCAVASVPS